VDRRNEVEDCHRTSLKFTENISGQLYPVPYIQLSKLHGRPGVMGFMSALRHGEWGIGCCLGAQKKGAAALARRELLLLRLHVLAREECTRDSDIFFVH
jgi:hypothetical protein